jgi:hypothetical protein
MLRDVSVDIHGVSANDLGSIVIRIVHLPWVKELGILWKYSPSAHNQDKEGGHSIILGLLTAPNDFWQTVRYHKRDTYATTTGRETSTWSLHTIKIRPYGEGFGAWHLSRTSDCDLTQFTASHFTSRLLHTDECTSYKLIFPSLLTLITLDTLLLQQHNPKNSCVRSAEIRTSALNNGTTRAPSPFEESPA